MSGAGHVSLSAPKLASRDRLGVFRPGRVQRQQLLPIDRHVTGRFDPKPNLAAVNVHHGDADVVADENLFAKLAAEDQHVAALLRARLSVLACLYSTPR